MSLVDVSFARDDLGLSCLAATTTSTIYVRGENYSLYAQNQICNNETKEFFL